MAQLHDELCVNYASSCQHNEQLCLKVADQLDTRAFAMPRHSPFHWSHQSKVGLG